ncbi:IS4 family transposase [Wolbachia endosymbiont (group B) of Eupithecia inturbata]|uniref:IS4 family transposase n=1 Tax=Wolbachia endosymbiont (group B) of Eupithecia inturbata TaxID=3139316 RepID=UPI003CCAD76A
MCEVNRNVQCADGLGDKWLEKELRHVNLGDVRLNKRLIKTSYLIENKASGSINQSCVGWKEAKGAYRLFSNEKLEAKEIYSSHYKETIERIKGDEIVFSVQDTSYLDFDSHIKTKGLGSISKAYTKHKKGLLLHSALIVNKDGLPLGLSSQQCWARSIREETAQEKANRKYRTAIKEKESYKWIAALKETLNNLAEGAQLVTIGDREADIFKFLWTIESLDSFYVIRNRTNRKFICIEGGKTDLQTRITQLPVKREIVLNVAENKYQISRKANIEVRYMKGYIPIRSSYIYGSKDTEHKISDKIAIYVVSAKETNPPERVEAIDWTLLTNVPVNSTLDAIERINWYKLRWKIEEYFRILKSGCKVESSRLATKERLEKLIAIKSIIAFKILYLTKVALSNPMEVCTKVLSNEEWKTLYIREHKVAKLPEEPPNIKQAIIWLGKLGGFMNRKSDNLPGTMTLWRGYENLRESMVMLRIMTSQSCG